MLETVRFPRINHNGSNSLSELQDSILIDRISTGDKLAMTEFISRYYYRIVDFSRCYMGSKADAEDIVQEAFTRVWLKAHLWQNRTVPVSSWLYRIVTNLCIDEIRKKKTVLNSSQSVDSINNASPESEFIQSENEEKLNNALLALSPRQRTAIALCAYQGFSNRDAAGIMDVSIDALESLLSRGRKHLRKLLIES